MQRERPHPSPQLRGKATTLLLLVVASLLTWTILKGLSSRSIYRHPPLQAPAGQEPKHRATPGHEESLIS